MLVPPRTLEARTPPAQPLVREGLRWRNARVGQAAPLVAPVACAERDQPLPSDPLGKLDLGSECLGAADKLAQRTARQPKQRQQRLVTGDEPFKPPALRVRQPVGA